jgi:hypothetical protein
MSESKPKHPENVLSDGDRAIIHALAGMGYTGKDIGEEIPGISAEGARRYLRRSKSAAEHADNPIEEWAGRVGVLFEVPECDSDE